MRVRHLLAAIVLLPQVVPHLGGSSSIEYRFGLVQTWTMFAPGPNDTETRVTVELSPSEEILPAESLVEGPGWRTLVQRAQSEASSVAVVGHVACKRPDVLSVTVRRSMRSLADARGDDRSVVVHRRPCTGEGAEQ